MPQINISGRQPGQAPLTPEQQSLKALYDDRMQAQIKQMEQMRNIRKRSIDAELSDIKQIEAAQKALDDNREKAMGKAVKGYANYTKLKTGLEHSSNAAMARETEAFDRNREKAMGNAVKGFRSYEKTKVSIEESAYKKREADATAFDRNREKAMGKAVKGFRNYEKQKVDEAERVQRAAQSQRHANIRGWAGAARTGAVAVAGIHGDFQGITTAVGALLGSLGGPLGAEIGSVAGEVIGKLVEGISTAPMAPGNIWNSYVGVSKPWMNLKTDAYAMARAGGYSGADSISSVLAAGDLTGEKQPAWMKLTGATPESVLKSINATGINPRSQGEFASMGQGLALSGNTSAFANLPDGMREKALGQGINYGATTAGESTKYLGGFAGTLEEAVAKGVDKGRVFSNMLDAIDMLAKNGAGGISSAAVNEAFMRSMMSGTPGGRSGEAAVASLSGTSAMLSNPLQSSSGMYGLMSVAQRFGGLKSADNVKQMVGARAMSAFTANNPDGQAYAQSLISQATKAANSGNLPMALDILAPILQADPGRVQDLVGDQFGKGGASDYIVAGMTGRSAQQVRQGNFGRDRVGSAGANGYDGQMANQRFLSGTGDDADTARALKNMGVPDAYIPMVMDAAKKTGQDPAKIAAIMWHESRFKANAFNRNANGTSDYGLMQTNDRYAAGDMSAAGITSSELAANAAGGALDPQKAIMAGAMHLRASGGDLVKYGGDNPTGRAAAAQEQDYIRSRLTQNIPTDVNEVTAMSGASVDKGSQTMFQNFNGLVKVAVEKAALAATAVRKFADALDGMKNADVSVGSNEGPNNWAAAGGANASPVAQRTNHFHVQQ